MSSIDNRIVQMQFENSQFEKGIKESTRSVKEFKKEVDFKEIQKAGDSFSLVKMAQGIDALTKRFSTMGIVGMRAIQNITDKAVNAGTRLVKSLSVDQITSGFTKYEDKTKAVQTIVNATGLSIEKVDEQLSKLAWFTDETSYNFVDMVSNIGKFTSMNVPLEDSVTAMQGIATWAAVSGQGVNEASRAMYNLSQAIGVGAVKLMDWKSIQNANMATSEFKQTAIDTAIALGVLKKGAKTSKGTAVTIENFDQTLQHGWFTKDVLLKTLQKYGEYSDEVYKIVQEEGIPAAEAMKRVSGRTMELGEKAFKAAQEAKTFTEAIDAVKDAVSTGWMTTFENIFGNYEEAKVLWTDLANDLWDIFASGAESRNELLEEWKNSDVGGRSDFLAGLYDMMAALKGIIQTVKDAFFNIFPKTTVEDLQKITTNLKEFGEQLKKDFAIVEKYAGVEWIDIKGVKSEMGEFDEELKRGSKGEGVKALQERLVELGYLTGENAADGIFGPKTEEALKKFQKATGETVDGVYKEATHKNLAEKLGFEEKEYLKGRQSVQKFVEILPPKLQRLSNVLEGVYSIVHILWTGLKFLYGVGKRILSVFSPVATTFGTIADAASRFFVALDEKISKSTKFQEWLEKLDNLLLPVKDKIQKFCDSVLELLGISGDLDDIDFSAVVDNLINAVKAFFGFGIDPNAVGEGIDVKTIVENIKAKITKVYTDIRDWIFDLFNVGEENKNLGIKKLNLDGYSIAIAAITAIVGILSTRLLQGIGVIISAGRNINGVIKNIKQTISAFKNKNRFEAFDILAEALLKLAGAIALIAGSLWLISRLSWSQLAVGFTGLIVIMGAMIGFIVVLNKITKKFRNIDKVATGLLLISGAIVALSIAVLMLGQLNIDQLIKGLLGMAGTLGLILIFLYALKSLNVDGKKLSSIIGILISLATAMSMFAEAINKIGSLDTDVLIKGLIGLGAVMVAVGIFLNKIKNVRLNWASVAGLVAAALAIDLMIAGFVVLTFAMKVMKPKDILKGIVGMIAIIAGMALLMKLVSKINPSVKAIMALLPIAIALDLVIFGFIALMLVLKKAEPKDIAKAIGGLVIMVVALVGVTKILGKVKINSIKGALALLPITIALTLMVGSFIALYIVLKKATPEEIAKTIVGMVAILTAMTLTLKAIGKIQFNSIKTVLAIVPVALAMVLAAGAFVLLYYTLRKARLEDIAKVIIAMATIVISLSVVTKALAGFTGGLRSSLAVLMSSIGIVLAIAAFAIALHYLKDINPDLIIKFGVALSSMMIAFGMLSLFSAVAGPHGIAMAMVAILGMAAVIGAIMTIVSLLAQIPGVAKFFKKGASALGEIIGSFVGSMKAAQIKAFTKGMKGFEGASDIDEAGLNKVLVMMDMMNEFSKKLPEKAFSKKLTDALFGSDMDNFSNDIAIFATKFRQFAAIISKVDMPKGFKNKVNNVLSISRLMLKFSKELEPIDTAEEIVAAFFGLTPMSVFISDATAYASGFNGFVSLIQAIDIPKGVDDKIVESTKILMPMAEFCNNLPTIDSYAALTAWQQNMTPMANFFSESDTFAQSFNGLATQLGKIDDQSETGLESKVTNALGIARQLNKFITELPEPSILGGLFKILKWDAVTTFSDQISMLADGLYIFAVKMQVSEENNPYDDGLEGRVTDALKIADLVKTFIEGLPEASILGGLLKMLKWDAVTIFSDQMSTLADGLYIFATKMKVSEENNPYDDGLEGRVTNALSIADQVKTFIEGLPEASILGGLFKILKWDAVTIFSDQMSTLADGLYIFAVKMKDSETAHPYDEGLEQRVTNALAIADQVKVFIEGLPEGGIGKGLLNLFKWDSVSIFSSQFTTIGEGLKTFSESMESVSNPVGTFIKTQYALSIARQVKSFLEDLPDTGFWSSFGYKIRDWWKITKEDTFKTDMLKFASTMSEYSQEMSQYDINGSVIYQTDQAVEVARKVADFLAQLSSLNIDTKKGAIKSWFTDETKQETVFDAVGDLAESINNSKDKYAGLSGDQSTIVEDVKSAVKIAHMFAWLLNTIGSDEYKNILDADTRNTGYSAYGNVLDAISEIGGRISEFGRLNVDTDLEAISGIIKGINEMYYIFQEGKELNLDNFLKASDVKQIADRVGNLNTTLGPTMQQSTEMLSSFSESFTGAGGDLAGATISAMGSADTSGVTTLASNMQKRVLGYRQKFVEVGENFAKGIADGVSYNEAVAVFAAQTVAKKMLEKLKEIFGEASPSKEAAKIGDFFTIGLANGVSENSNLAVGSASNIATSMLEAAKGPLATLSSIIAEGIDDSPVITPVVDLTNARLAAGSIGSMFGTQSFGVRSRIMAGNAINTPQGRPVSANQNSSNGVIEAVNGMNENVGALGEAISNMQMVVDSGALVGHVAGKMDKQLGIIAMRKGRMG